MTTSDDGWTKKVPATGAGPLTAEDRAPDPTQQLETLRKLAGEWRTGQFGILGLISIVTVFKSEREVSHLAGPAGIVVGAATLLSLATACWAVFLLSRVAWGWPKLQLRTADRALTDAERVVSAVSWVNQGVLLTFLSVASLALGLAVGWYAPSAASAHLVRVDGVNGPTCGELVSANPQKIVVSSGKTRAEVELRLVATIVPVDACP